MKTLTATQSVPKLSFVLNLPWRLAGGFYAAFGLAALVKLWQSAPSGGTAMNIAAWVIVTAFTLVGAWLAFSVDNVSLNPSSKTYTLSTGIWPLLRYETGPFSNVDSISIAQRVNVPSDGDSGQSDPSNVLVARIELKNPLSSIELAISPDSLKGAASIRAKAEAIAQIVGCSVKS